MYLRDIAVGASTASQMPAGWTQRDFNASTHAPVEAYFDLLPRRTVVLNDFAKVNLYIGKRPPGTKMYWAVADVAMAYWPWFDFQRYFKSSRVEQQKRVAEVLHKTLLRIATLTQSRQYWYEKAFSAFQAKLFPLPEITDFEMRRRWGLLRPREKRTLKRHRRTG